VLCVSAWFIYSGGATVLNSGEPLNTLWGLAQLVSAGAGITGTFRREPRLVLFAAVAAVVSVLIVIAPSFAGLLTGVRFPEGEGGQLLFGLLLVILLPPLVMLWGASAMARAKRPDLRPKERASPHGPVREARSVERSSMILFGAAVAIAIALHVVVGSLFGTAQGRRLDPNSWGLQTFTLALGVVVGWRGFKEKRAGFIVPGVLIAVLAVIWIAQTG